MKNQTKYFIIGAMLEIIAILIVTVLPFILKLKFEICTEDYKFACVYSEFIILCIAGVFYLFSPKYYINQIQVTLVLALAYGAFAFKY